MAEYSATKEGFHRSMKWSLTGPPEEAVTYAKATVTDGFYHVMNGEKADYDGYIKTLAEWRGKTSDYELTIHEFLRDGDQLAARFTGTIKIGGVVSAFETFQFAKVDKDSGNLEWLIERSVYGPVGGAPTHGA